MAIITWAVVRDTPRKPDSATSTPRTPPAATPSRSPWATWPAACSLNPVAITIAAAEFCTGLVRKGFEEWFPRYMQEAQHLALDNPIFKSGAFAIVIAGIAGAFLAGTLSDWVFKSRRPPVAFIGYALQIVCLLVICERSEPHRRDRRLHR